MCHLVTERFFHNCGHIDLTEVHTINPECSEELSIVEYYGNRFCPRCIWGKFEPESRYSTTLSLRCNDRQGKVRTLNLQNVDNWNAITKDELWTRRNELIERFRAWHGDILGVKFHGEYSKIREVELSRCIPIQNQLYYLGPGPFDKNFLRIIEMDDVPDDKENCLCGFSVKVQGEEKGEGGEPCMLPCGHIFGYNCILRWIEGKKSDICPQCSSFIRIWRVDVQFGYLKGYLEHFTYDHDSNVWQNNLRSLLNALLIYGMMMQLLFIAPMPPWTDPNMVFLATLWIPYTLCVESNLFQFCQSLALSRFKEVTSLFAPH